MFITSKTKDFAPALKNEKGDVYKNTESFKLLGVNFQTDQRKGLTWETYINTKIKCAYANMWILRRLYEMGVTTQKLILVFKSKVRVHIEMNVPLWTFSINKTLSNKIEKVQRTALLIILGHKASPSYHSNLKTLNLDTLESRRDLLVKRFARKTIKNPAHRNMFKHKQRSNTRNNEKIIIPFTKRKRYENSAIPSLAKIIVENNFK